MLKKLLAAMFVATLALGGMAQAGDVDHVADGGAWNDLTGSGNPLPTGTVTIGDNDGLFISNSDSAVVSANLDAVTIGGGSGGASLTVGTSSAAYDGGSIATGPVNLTVASLATDTASGNTVTVGANSTLDIAGNITLVGTDVVTNGGTITLGGTGADLLGTSLAAGNIGTVNLNGAVTTFVTTGTSGGTVVIASQSSALTGPVDVGGADLSLAGGDYSGSSVAITAKSLTFTDNTTKIGAGTITLTNGFDISSGATVQIDANRTVATSAADAVSNAGTIEILGGKTLTVGDNYTSTNGAIDNTANASTAGLVIDTTLDTTAVQAATYLDDLVRGGTGNIGNIKFNDKVAGNIAATTGTITGGKVTLGQLQDAVIDVNVGGADLVATGTGTNTLGNVTAGELTNTTGALLELSGVVAADVKAGANIKFTGPDVRLNGDLTLTAGGVSIEGGANITIANGKTLTNAASNVQVTGGASLTLAGGSNYVTGGRLIIDSSTSITIDAAVLDGANNPNLAAAVGDVDLGNSGSATLNITNTTNTDYKAAGIALHTNTLSGTVNVDMNGYTLGNNTNALDAKGAKIVFKGDGIMDGLVKTADTSATAISVDAGKTVTFANGVETGTGGTIAQGTGSKGIYTGDVKAKVNLTGSTFETAGAGATLYGNFTADANSVISIGENSGSPGNASTLDANGTITVAVDANTKLLVDSNVADGSTIFGNTLVTNAVNSMSQPAVDAWLAANTSSSLTSDSGFRIVGGVVVYDKQAAAPSAARMNSVLAQNGSADFAPLVNNNLINGLVIASGIVDGTAVGYPTYASLSARDKNIVDVMDALAGNTNANFGNYTGLGNVSYAGYRWATGQDLANSIEAVTDTVRNFGKAVVKQAIRPNAVGTADFGSTAAYGAPLTMLDCNNYANRIWAGYTGMWGDADARGGDRGYDYDAHGFNIGYDRAFSNGFSFGAAFGYSKGDFDLKGGLGSDSDIDNYSFALYGSWQHCSGLFTTLVGSYTYSDYDMNNQYAMGLWDRADYHSDTWNVGGEVGYEFRPARNFALIPTLGLYYYDSSTNRFNTSSGRLGMKYDNSSLEMPIEVTAKYDVCIGAETNLTLTATGGYTYNFRDKGTKIDRFVMGGTGIVMGGDRGRSAGHSGWNIGAGANMQYRNFDFGVNYEYNARSDYDSHNLWVNAGIRF